MPLEALFRPRGICDPMSQQDDNAAPSAHIDIVFDGPPGPTAGRFIEVEDAAGKSIRFGKWLQRSDGYWVFRIASPESAQVAARKIAAEKLERVADAALEVVYHRDVIMEAGLKNDMAGMDQLIEDGKDIYPELVRALKAAGYDPDAALPTAGTGPTTNGEPS